MIRFHLTDYRAWTMYGF